MKKYGIYSYTVDTPERTKMLEVYPTPAIYEDEVTGFKVYLFASTYENLFKEVHPNSSDISHIRLVEDKSETDEEGNPIVYEDNVLTYAEFDAWMSQMMSQEHTGIELVINRQCAKRLYETIFKPEVTEEEVI